MIYQGLLDRLTDAYNAGDFLAFQQHIRLPHEITTPDESFVIQTVDEMKKVFQRHLDYSKQIGMNIYHRRCLEAQFLEGCCIKGTHVSRLMRDAVQLTPPFEVECMMHRIEGQWLLSSAFNRAKRNSSVRHALRAVQQQGSEQPDKGTNSPTAKET
ncbi:hypothetical protein DFP92_101299 [Yoonia sediminilitoris]|uniref:SnoaL-like protein n=1 Tax=Yoonia sediminilitoris TaxID=1286148 RepID=A0A2T6KQ83_9RHOB|nr:hypothetical protein C8N45_101299 [Yoonia sediminilitoris]RCW98882.1 hypothetical protein DFP92_101299 [Yoonia sediminilitoris]